MIGAIIGDIVGSRFEFNNYRKKDFLFFHPDCRFTDDTVCTMAVADWVVNHGDWGVGARFAWVLQDWCRRYPLGDYGGMFRMWINNPVPYNSFGNGAAMRISPVGYSFDYDDRMIDAVGMVTSVSHNHPEGLKGAMATATAISMARQGLSKFEICREVVNSFDYDLNTTCAKIRKTNTFDETCQVTVPQALVCFLESTSFEDCIRLAISIGGDSDTIAAIAGSIAEAFWGVPEWMKLYAMRCLTPEMHRLVLNFYKTINHESVPF